MSDIKIAACVPGNRYSRGFFGAWTELVCSGTEEGWLAATINEYSPQVHEARNMCVSRAMSVYDYITHVLFIDSDIGFTVGDVRTFIRYAKLMPFEEDVFSGYYAIDQKGATTAVKRYSFENPKKNVKMLLNDCCKQLAVVDAVGFGFILLPKAVFSKIQYPWFDHRVVNNEIFGEDYSFCYKMRKAGYSINLIPSAGVLHEKTVFL